MNLPRCFLRVAAVIVVLAGFSLPAHATINYTISLARPDQHRFHVRMAIPGAAGNLEVQMAAWDALYQIRDFAARVIGLHAEDAAGPVVVEKVDKETWKIKA
ncbi:MAG: hypothetical protein ACLP1Y_11560, partial [Candidatus Acidiferrales bacterium]